MLLLSRPVMSDSLQPPGLQHARPPCPSASPKVYPSSCPLHWWCHPAISSSDALFSFCPQSFQHQGLFQWVICLRQVTKNTGAGAMWVLVSSGAWAQHQSFQEYSRLISLKIDWFDLLVVHGLSGGSLDWPDDHVQFTLIYGHSRFLCNTVFCSIRFYFHHQTHPQLIITSTLGQPLHSFWGC